MDGKFSPFPSSILPIFLVPKIRSSLQNYVDNNIVIDIPYLQLYSSLLGRLLGRVD